MPATKAGEYIIVKDNRDGKLFLDSADSMIRIFESIEDQGSRALLKERWPQAVDLTARRKP